MSLRREETSFGHILNGAAVYPIDVRQEDFAGLAQWMMERENHDLSIVSPRRFAPSLSHCMAIEAIFSCLRLIGLTGETVYKSDFELYKKHFSDACVFVNRYGPNEVGRIAQYLLSKLHGYHEPMLSPSATWLQGQTIQLVDDDGELAAIRANRGDRC